MTNREIQSYQNMGIPMGRKARKVKHFDPYECLENGLAFLLSKIYLLGMLSPLGLSYFSAVFPKQKGPFAILSVCLGIFASGMGIYSLKYVGALVIMTTTFILFAEELKKRTWLYPLISAGALLFSGIIFVIFDGFLLYDCMALLLECILLFLSYFVFEKGTEALRGFRERTVFEPMETLSLVVLSAGVILSLGSLPYLQGAAHVLSLLIIFVVGLTCGFPLSCTTGVILGLCNSLNDVLPAQVVAVYSVSALCGGLLRNRGRWGVALGFLASNLLSVLYFDHLRNQLSTLYYVIFATVILFLIPDRFLSLFGAVASASADHEDAAERLREIMADKLKAASDSFTELSGLFHEAVEARLDSEIRNPGYVFDRTADSVCRECTLVNYCWQKEYAKTRHALLTLYNRMEKRGRAELQDVPEPFKNECIRLDTFLENLNQYYDLHKINLMWAGRVSESRNLVATQFQNISSVLEHLKEELGAESDECIRMERRIAAALDRKGIQAERIRVTGQENYEVTMTLPSCGGERVCSNTVAVTLGAVLGVPMLRVPVRCEEQTCRLRFCEKPRFSVETGFASRGSHKDGFCGDNHMFSQTGDGKYILALSDGMGQGQKADSQSSMTVHLMGRLIDSGFDKETALKLINSMLLVSGERESFATADLCLVNLYSGALEFIKIGAANSYVKSQKGVETIRCSSLPAGVVCELEADCDLKFAKAGDYVVLATDGITEPLESGGESLLGRLIEKHQGDSPQRLADDILRAALLAGDGKEQDDMTVLVARITEL